MKLKAKKEEILKEKSEFDILRTPNHIKIYATNGFVGCSNQDVRIDLCNEKLRNEEKNRWGYVIDATVFLTPIGAKRLFNSMKKCLDKFEKEHGDIDVSKEENKISFV